MLRDYLAVPQDFSIAGQSPYDAMLNILSLKLIYVPLIIAVAVLALWFLMIGILTGSKHKRTISYGNFWLLLTGILIMIVVFVGFIGLLWLINK